MSLAINFQIADEAAAAFTNLGTAETKLRAVIVALDDEKVVLQKTVEATKDLDADCVNVGDACKLSRTSAGVIFFKTSPTDIYEIVLVPSDAKPKVRLSYASATSHLRTAVEFKVIKECHIDKTSEIAASLFHKVSQEDRESMMTDSERVNAETKRQIEEELKTAPVAVALPGMVTPFTQEAKDALDQFKDGALDAVYLDMVPQGITVVQKLDKGVTIAEMAANLRSATPKFMVARFSPNSDDKIGLVYLCPPDVKPRVKIVYATSKSSVVKHIKGVFENLQSFEVEQAATLDAKVAEHFK